VTARAGVRHTLRVERYRSTRWVTEKHRPLSQFHAVRFVEVGEHTLMLREISREGVEDHRRVSAGMRHLSAPLLGSQQLRYRPSRTPQSKGKHYDTHACPTGAWWETATKAGGEAGSYTFARVPRWGSSGVASQVQTVRVGRWG